MRHHIAKIDWKWVKNELLTKERIAVIGESRAGSSILASANECLRICRSKVAPRILSVRKKAIDITGLTIPAPLTAAPYLYIMAATIGRGVEEAATRYMKKGDFLLGYLIDRIGSFACESLIESVEENLRKSYARKGMSVSVRFSPGYCDIPIEEQFKLDKALGLSRIGIRINKNCMMVPKKSITAMVGVGPKGLFGKKKSQCSVCLKSDCSYRR